MQGPLPTGKAWVVQSRRGRGYVKAPDGDINFIVDFDGPVLRALGAEPKLDAIVSVDSNAELREHRLQHRARSEQDDPGHQCARTFTVSPTTSRMWRR